MKKLFFFFVLSCVASTVAAQTSCNPFYTFKEGVKYSYDSYNAKDKVTGRTVHQYKNVRGSGNNMSATMVLEMIDVKKNEVITSSESEWTCKDGVMNFSMASMTSMDGMQSTPNMDVQFTGDMMDIPSSFQVGQTMKDIKYNIKMNVSGMTMMDRTFEVKERKVEKRESVTTPAGTFECYKVTFITESQGRMGGTSKPTKSSVWYAHDVGMVKMENYKDDGKIAMYQLLTKIEK